MMAEIQDVHMFKRKSLKVTMFRMMLGTHREFFEVRLQDLLQIFNVTIAVRKDKEGVTLTNEHNDFLVADATRMEEIEELRPSYDFEFLNEVQKPSTSYVNPLFAKDKQPKIINDTIGDDQINSNIILNEPNVDVNCGSVEYDNNVQASYELEQLARNA
ncbi:hypothetical protein Tco_0417878 [Tanacetum coccineum]